jgi:hypothetical protein
MIGGEIRNQAQIQKWLSSLHKVTDSAINPLPILSVYRSDHECDEPFMIGYD